MLTHNWRKTLLILALTLFALVASAGWYLVQKSMNVAREFEVNEASASPKVLIATQGSDFKEAVVAGVVKHLEARGAYVKGVDISSLPEVDEGAWDAIVLVHTWEIGRPPPDVKTFVDRLRNKRKLAALTTSGRGDNKIGGVDVISSASRMDDVPRRVAELTTRIDAILQATE